MKETTARLPIRDMSPSGFSKVLEIFFGGNHEVDAAVVFDRTGETIDYHTYLDPYDSRVAAAYMGILFDLTQYKMRWLIQAKVQMMEISCTGFNSITLPICDDYFLFVMTKSGDIDPAFLDTVMGAVEVLRKEIDY